MDPSLYTAKQWLVNTVGPTVSYVTVTTSMLTTITHDGIYRQLGLDISRADNCDLYPSRSQFRPQAVKISLEGMLGGRIYNIQGTRLSVMQHYSHNSVNTHRKNEKAGQSSPEDC